MMIDNHVTTRQKLSPAVVMVTHLLEPRILRHFERLRAECGLSAYLAYHAGVSTPRPDLADLNITDEELGVGFSRRFSELSASGRPVTHGYSDIVFATAALKPDLAAYDHIWIVEYDVDFSGCWSDFFLAYAESEADLLTANVRMQFDDPDWHHWKRFRHPPGVEPIASFQPASRFSRSLLDAHRDQMEDARWRGHHEAILPSLARSLGMTIEDICGTGRFAPLEPRFTVTRSTFGFLPLKSTSYFHEEPDLFAEKEALYHPVKITAPSRYASNR